MVKEKAASQNAKGPRMGIQDNAGSGQSDPNMASSRMGCLWMLIACLAGLAFYGTIFQLLQALFTQ